MPQFMEARLRASARKRGLKSPEAINAYVHGALNNMGYERGNKITPKGRAAQRKHERDYGRKG